MTTVWLPIKQTLIDPKSPDRATFAPHPTCYCTVHTDVFYIPWTYLDPNDNKFFRGLKDRYYHSLCSKLPLSKYVFNNLRKLTCFQTDSISAIGDLQSWFYHSVLLNCRIIHTYAPAVLESLSRTQFLSQIDYRGMQSTHRLSLICLIKVR